MGTDLNGKRLPPGISQRKDGRYVARYTTTRGGKRKTIYGTSVRELKKKLDEAKYKDRMREEFDGDMLLDEWHEQWEKIYLEKSPLSLSTKSSYETYYRKYIKDSLGSMKVGDIRGIHIREFFSELANEKNLSAASISGIKGLLSNVMNSCVENGMISRNPVQNVPIPKTKEPRTVTALTKKEQDILISECEESPYGNFIKAQLGSGMRCGEVAALKPGNIDFDKRMIHVTSMIAYRKVDGKMGYYLTKPKTKASIRKIPMSNLFMEAVGDEMKRGNSLSPKFAGGEMEGLIFLTAKGYPICPQYYDAELKRIVNRINEKYDGDFPMFASHAIRHSFCTRLIEKGVNIKNLQTIMGHASIKQTLERYSHSQEEFLLTVIDDLDDIF